MLQNHISNLINRLSGRVYPSLIHLTCARFWLSDQNVGNRNKVEISLNAQKGWLKVDNASGSEFVFIRVDGEDSIFGSSPPPVENEDLFVYDSIGTRAGACDCLLIENILHFIEFKTNSTSENLEQIELNRIKAEFQLARTITFFSQNNLDLIAMCRAVIVTPTQYAYPRFRADRSRSVKFKKKWKVSLEEISVKDVYEIY